MRVSSANPFMSSVLPAQAASVASTYGASAVGKSRGTRRGASADTAEPTQATDSAELSPQAANVFTPLRMDAAGSRMQTIARMASLVGGIHQRT